jgi:flagellar biosynthesis/type III secretory pathway protein FliH
MPYISRYELRAMEKGEQKGRIEGEQKGRSEGEQKGRIEGEQKGGVKILLQMLQRRYGTITESLQTEISSLSLGQLEKLGSAILEFNHEVDLTAWLEKQTDEWASIPAANSERT